MAQKQKKLMLLGGIRYLLPAIEAAHQQGYYVITADYLPDNIAHKYSDEYINVSIIDKEAVLKLAVEKQIDGILSFAVDPGVITAAYIQEKMHLPAFGPYESVVILQTKNKFRQFLTDNGFNVPKTASFSTKEEAMAFKKKFDYPVMVKPTDSSGSKGVSRVDSDKDLPVALDLAFESSRSGHVIVEDFIEKQGCSSDCDCFTIDGKLSFAGFSAQRFDVNAVNPYTPSSYSWPCTFTTEQTEYIEREIQRCLSLLGMKTCLYNIEVRIGINGKPYIMEITPRAGGNRLAEMVRFATGVDMITASVRAAVGDSVSGISQKPYIGNWAEIILHANKDGNFQKLTIDPLLPAEVVETDLWVHEGDAVEAFNGANKAIGTLVLKFDSQEVLVESLSDISKWLKVEVV